MSTPSKSKASPRVHVDVTADVIADAKRRDSSHCMIAEAIKKAVPTARFVSVDLATIRFTDIAAGRRYIYLTPRSAQEALLDFDQGETSEPFQFRLQSAHVLATGSARKGRTTLEARNRGNNGVPPERRDGQSPPIGPLAGGSLGRSTASRTGRVRQFGLRAVIR